MISAPTDALRVIDNVFRAWSENDADAFVRDYAEDATAVLPGALLAGRAAVHATMTAAFAGPLQGSHGVQEVLSVRPIGDDVVVVLGKSTILFAGEIESPADRWSHATWVLSRHNDTWQVRAYHACQASVD